MASSSSCIAFIDLLPAGSGVTPYRSMRDRRAVDPTRPARISRTSAVGVVDLVAEHGEPEPAPGVSPVVVGRRGGDAECPGSVLDGQAAEVAELDEVGLPLVLGL